MTALAEWQNFYVIVGSSAGALIGLQFVVMALIANMPGTQLQGGEAFITPAIVHFGTALLLAGAMTAPWHGIAPVVVLWGLTGIAGVSYAVVIVRHVRKQSVYQPEFEDWLFHAVLPCLAYTGLIASACAGIFFERPALFGVAAATALLLFVGIHNAWDNVAYHVFIKKQGR
jgi:hypothetical protein